MKRAVLAPTEDKKKVVVKRRVEDGPGTGHDPGRDSLPLHPPLPSPKNQPSGLAQSSLQTIQAKLTVGPVNDPYEQEADQVAQQLSDRPIQRLGLTIQRTPAKVLKAAHLHGFTQAGNNYTVKKGKLRSGRVGPKLPAGGQVEILDPVIKDTSNEWVKAKTTDGATNGFIRLNKIELLPDTAPNVDMTNIPLTGGDLQQARRMTYRAAILVANEAAGSRRKLSALVIKFSNEAQQVTIPNQESLLTRLAKGDMDPLKEVFSKKLSGELAGRIAAISGEEADDVEEKLKAKLLGLINADGRWTRFAKNIEIGGQDYSSVFTPINQDFDPTFAQHGNTGYSSMTAQTPTKFVPVEERGRVTNAWVTSFKKGDSVGGETLLETFRSGAFAEKGLKGNREQQLTVAKSKAYDLLKAMAIQYLQSQEPGDQQAILGGRVPTISVVSTGLLTSLLGKIDTKMIQVHSEAFETYHNVNTAFDISFGGGNHSIMVKFNVIAFNKAVNEFRSFGGSRSTPQLELNERALPRLRQLKVDGLQLLNQKVTNNNQKLSGLVNLAPNETLQSVGEANEELRVKIAKITQLWQRVESMTDRKGGVLSGSGSRYELPALMTNLGYQLGAMVHFNCMSGKDRTGMADVESKLLAYQMDKRVEQARALGLALDQVELVPKYTGDFSEGDAEAFAKLIFEGGNLDIQKLNTTVAGFKIRGAMMNTTIGSGRLGQALDTKRGQQVLRQYLGLDESVNVKAKEFSKMINALSGFTGA